MVGQATFTRMMLLTTRDTSVPAPTWMIRRLRMGDASVPSHPNTSPAPTRMMLWTPPLPCYRGNSASNGHCPGWCAWGGTGCIPAWHVDSVDENDTHLAD